MQEGFASFYPGFDIITSCRIAFHGFAGRIHCWELKFRFSGIWSHCPICLVRHQHHGSHETHHVLCRFFFRRHSADCHSLNISLAHLHHFQWLGQHYLLGFFFCKGKQQIWWSSVPGTYGHSSFFAIKKLPGRIPWRPLGFVDFLSGWGSISGFPNSLALGFGVFNHIKGFGAKWHVCLLGLFPPNLRKGSVGFAQLFSTLCPTLLLFSTPSCRKKSIMSSLLGSLWVYLLNLVVSYIRSLCIIYYYALGFAEAKGLSRHEVNSLSVEIQSTAGESMERLLRVTWMLKGIVVQGPARSICNNKMQNYNKD